MASNLIAMASNLVAMASNLVAMASNLIAMASNLIAMASNLIAMASNLKDSFDLSVDGLFSVPRARSIFYLFVLLWSFQGVLR